MNRSRFPVLAIIAAIVANPLVTCGATTTPVGAIAKDIVVGSQLISVPFQKPKVFQGPVVSISGSTIGLAAVPALTNSSYLQVLSGTAVGSIATIASSTSNSVSLTAPITGLAMTDSVAIREHVTLADIAVFVNAQELETVTLFDLDGTVIYAEFYNGYGWYDLINAVEANAYPVLPGEGIVINASAPRSAVYYGTVSDDPVNFQFAGSNILTLAGTLDPVINQPVGTLFGGVPELTLLSTYDNVGGNIVLSLIAEYYNGYGYYDLINEVNADSSVVSVGGSAVLQSPSGGTIVHPAAYTP